VEEDLFDGVIRQFRRRRHGGEGLLLGGANGDALYYLVRLNQLQGSHVGPECQGF
jgi:hypothetical protein